MWGNKDGRSLLDGKMRQAMHEVFLFFLFIKYSNFSSYLENFSNYQQLSSCRSSEEISNELSEFDDCIWS
jgi:hypothetical protein